MEINVNKGIISFSYENPTKGTTLSYQYDINNCAFIGKSGKQVKTIQNKTALVLQLKKEFQLSSFYADPTEKTPNSLTLLAFLYGLDWGNHDRLNILVPIANKLDSLHLDIVKHLNSICEITGIIYFQTHSKEIKLFKEWFEEKLATDTNFIFKFNDFFTYASEMEILKNKPFLENITDTKEKEHIVYNFYKGNHYNHFNEEEKEIAEYYYIQRQLYKIDCFESSLLNIWTLETLLRIRNYFDICKKMGIKPQKEKDFFRLYKDTLSTYYYNKKEYDIKAFVRNYEKQKNAFTFSYGDYEIVIPQEPQDLIKEGQEMHHCVGSYVDKVVANKCYIVFVRNKSDLNTPYITAEVDAYGKLNQYFLAYDKKITLDKDKEFKEMFQKHLTKNWVDLD